MQSTPPASSSPSMCHVDRIPHDLFRWLVSTFFEDEWRFPLITLLVLQFVSRRFRDATRHSNRWMEFKYTAPKNIPSQQRRLSWEACRESPLDLVRWLVERLKYKPNVIWCEEAATGGHPDTLQWLVSEQRITIQTPIVFISAAAKSGKREMLDWAMQNVPGANDALPLVISNVADLAMLRYIHEELKISITANADAFARSGNIPLLQYAIESGAKLTNSTFAHAALGRSIEAVRWLQQQYPDRLVVDETVVWCASSVDRNLHMIKFLREQLACPWHESVLINLIKCDDVEAFRWCFEHGCPQPSIDWGDVFFGRQTNVSFGMLELLHQLMPAVLQSLSAYPYPKRAFLSASLPSIRFLLDKGILSKPTEENVLQACRSESAESLAVVRYLIEELHVPPPSTDTLMSSRKQIRLDVWRYLEEQGFVTGRSE